MTTSLRLPSDRVERTLLALLAFAVWSLFAAIHAHVKAADFYVFWTAARHWQAPYDPKIIADLAAAFHIHGQLPFVYPPTFLVVAWPFAQLPLALAYPLWTGLSAALFVSRPPTLSGPPGWRSASSSPRRWSWRSPLARPRSSSAPP